jgi:hypothetical protein
MFIYDKTIDEWSHEMIKGVEQVWGTKISTQQKTNNIKTIPFLCDYLNNWLLKYGDNLFKRFKTVTGISYTTDEFGYCINTTGVSLHNTEKFFISIGLSHAFNTYPTVMIHELLHIYFYKFIHSKVFLKENNFAKIEDLINVNEQNDLKEILTVLINEEFQDFIDTTDTGYPGHEALRRNVIHEWRKCKNFGKLIITIASLYKIKKDDNRE